MTMGTRHRFLVKGNGTYEPSVRFLGLNGCLCMFLVFSNGVSRLEKIMCLRGPERRVRMWLCNLWEGFLSVLLFSHYTIYPIISP